MQGIVKPHILILGDGFGAPAYNPRLRAICSYLEEQGYVFDLVVERIAELSFEHSYPIHEIALYSGGRWDWMVKNIRSLFTDWKNRHFSRLVEKRFGSRHYDIVFCTTFYTFPLRAAVDFGRRHHIPVITDVRDLAEQAPGNAVHYLAHRNLALRLFVKPYRWINIRRRNRQLRQADAITTVSPWHVDFLKHLNPHTYLVYNGYDEKQFVPADVVSQEFILSYCGNFFGLPIHNPELLFSALRQLPDIPYRLHCYTGKEGQALLRTWASRYGITDRIECHDFMAYTAIPAVYHESSILLVFTNTASAQNVHGLMTTKFFEALGVEKPVLCVRSDEECLAQVIRDTNAGLAATTEEEVCRFIRDKYAEWKAKGFTRQPVLNKQLFSRRYQAQQIEEIIEKLKIEN